MIVLDLLVEQAGIVDDAVDERDGAGLDAILEPELMKHADLRGGLLLRLGARGQRVDSGIAGWIADLGRLLEGNRGRDGQQHGCGGELR